LDLIKELIRIKDGEIKGKGPIKTKEDGEIKVLILIREDGATKDPIPTKVEIKAKDLEATKDKDSEVTKAKDLEATKGKDLTIKEDKVDGETKGKEIIKEDGATMETREGKVLEDKALAVMSNGKVILGSNLTKTGVLQDS
jgi:hypothetical protein